MTPAFSGGCLCGAVHYHSTDAPVGGGHCYCVDCRKSSGTGHCSHVVAIEETFTVTGDLSQFDAPADSGNLVSRYFCPTCGSAVFSKNSGMPGMVFPRASSLDNPEHFKPELSVYTARAPSWDSPDTDLPSFDGMPPAEAMPDM